MYECGTAPLMVVLSDVLYIVNFDIRSWIYPKRVKHLLKPTLYDSG